ncbi:MAG: hypothetical protein M0Z60_11755 [Nitrospiraceae bacterium]|nr:hypothetical protein [Nitrospiraceae bacterium]
MGVRSITITINALTHLIAEKVYSRASWRGKTYHGKEAAELIVTNQQRGLINRRSGPFPACSAA